MEAWELKTSDERQEDTIDTYIIFCEDEVSEPGYFRSFQVDKKVKVNAIENQQYGWRNVTNAMKYCVDEGLVEFVEETGFHIKEGTTENIWCVYDRDMEHEDPAQIDHYSDQEFSNSIQFIKNAGFNPAWSNDAFELWLLLHFKDVPVGQRLHRNYIYQQLTEVFKTVEPRTAELDKITKNPYFNYKQTFKRQVTFTIHILPYLKEPTRRTQAIERAKILEATYPNTVPYHSRNPCTKVHLLVEELLSYQE